MPSLLFVCTGNTCRSPMAMALFQARLRQNGLDESTWRVESAGTWAMDGSPAVRFARETMAARGLDLSSHRSQTVRAELLEQFNLILVMEPNHKEALCVEFPALCSRIYLLSEMAGQKEPVEDPIGKESGEYKKCAGAIDSWLERGWSKILQLA